MHNEFNTINSHESLNDSSKSRKFIENTKDAVRKALTTLGIAASTLLPMTSASLLSACSGDGDGTEVVKDVTAPTINLLSSSVDITGGKQIRITGNQLYIGDVLIASWSDDTTKNCKVSLSINGKDISSGTTISEEGTLTIKVSDAAGNVKTATVKLNVVNAPEITVNQYEINIFGGEKVSVSNNQLLLGDEVIASRKDNSSNKLTVSLKFNGQEIKSGDTIDGAGKLSITITNEKGKSSNTEITVTNEAIYGLDNLRNQNIQVDQEVNLLNGITFANGVELVKTEIEMDGKRTTIADPYHYTPEYPGKCSIIFTIKGKNGNTAEVKVDNLTIKALEYKAITITNINPEDLMPKVETGDKNVYRHIEHLRIPESTVITDMMWKYGAGNHSPEEYQQLMMRLNTGMLGENPVDYDNYEAVGGTPSTQPSNHAHAERFILNTLLKHANFKVINGRAGEHRNDLYNLCKSNPTKINIMGLSKGADANKNEYDGWHEERFKPYDKEKNRLVFCAGGNIRNKSDGTLLNKIYQEDYNLPDEHSVYGAWSRAHNKNDNTLDRHLLITFGTDNDGDIDQTNETGESSKFPVGFHNKVLFAGRTLPYRLYNGDKIGAAGGKYNTSFTNYVNVAIADLCFQMKADIADVDELLEMIRSTTLTDHIRFNGADQPLQLMNPAGFFKKYLMPTDLPSTVQSGKTTPLNKGYYKGVIFDIPGAEVKINGEWVAYNNANKSLIMSQNPMTLEWRLNGNLCKKLGYEGKSVNGKIIVVDDKWNGLNIDKDFTVNI